MVKSAIHDDRFKCNSRIFANFDVFAVANYSIACACIRILQNVMFLQEL